MNEPLSPRIIQLIGIFIIVGSITYSIITSRPVVEFLGTGVSLITLGSVWTAQVHRTKDHEYKVPPKNPPTDLDN